MYISEILVIQFKSGNDQVEAKVSQKVNKDAIFNLPNLIFV